MLLSRRFLTLVISVFLLNSGVLFAQDEAGKKLYQGCVECHGADGLGSKDQQAPRIAGQHDWYLLTQFKAFKTKTRNNPKTLAAIAHFSDKELSEIALYISKMNAGKPAGK